MLLKTGNYRNNPLEVKAYDFVANNAVPNPCKYRWKISNGGTFFDNLDLIDGNIDYLYLVDSYGSIYPESLSQLIENIKEV